MNVFEIATEVVANKFTALFGAILIILVLTKHLVANVKYRREGMESRIRFLEEQALLSSEVELECVSISSSAVQLLSAAATGGNRKAYDKDVQDLGIRSINLRNLIAHRHEALRERLTKPLVR